MEQELDFSEFDSHENQDNTLSFVPSNIENEVTMDFSEFDSHEEEEEDEEEEILSEEEEKRIAREKFFEKYYSDGPVPTLPPSGEDYNFEKNVLTDPYNLTLFRRISETSLVYEEADSLGNEFNKLKLDGRIPEDASFLQYIRKEPFSEIEKQRINEKYELKSNINILSNSIQNGDFGEFARVFDKYSGGSLSIYALGLITGLEKYGFNVLPSVTGDLIEPIIAGLEKGATIFGGDEKTLDPAFYFATVKPDINAFNLDIDLNPKQVTDNILNNIRKMLEFIGTQSGFGTTVGSYGGVARLIEDATTQLNQVSRIKKQKRLQEQGISLLEDLTRLDTRRTKINLGKGFKSEASIISGRIRAGNIAEQRAAEVKKIADNNWEMRENFIEAFEKNLSINQGLNIDDPNFIRISKVVNGRRVIDEKIAREVGVDIMRAPIETIDGEDVAVPYLKRSKDAIDAEQPLQTKFAGETFTSPMLIPEKLDAMVSIAVKYKEKFPEAFKNDKTVIDNLLKLAVKGDIDGQELVDDLAKVNLSFEDYVLTVVSSGSEAGRILQKLSMIKRSKTFTEARTALYAIDSEREMTMGKVWRRFDNIRRGGIVSQVATAFRNLSSGLIRSPLDFFTNVFEEGIRAYGKEVQDGIGIADQTKRMLLTGPLKTTETILPITQRGRNTFKGAFNQLQYMLNHRDAKDYTRYILDDPEFVKFQTSLFDRLNEMQENLGKGKWVGKIGKPVDKTLSFLENQVYLLNTPNRWQEHILRSSYFLGTLERHFKREWGIDIITEINKGNLPDILKETSRFRPKPTLYKEGEKLPKEVLYKEGDKLPRGKKVGDVRIPAAKVGDVKRQPMSVEEMIKDSADRALDATYSNSPDFGPFEVMRDLIVNYGGTIVLPFPNFIFKSMEYIASYGIGANPLIRKLIFRGKGGRYIGTTFGEQKVTSKDYQMAARNLQGLAVFYAAYEYNKLEDTPKTTGELNFGTDAEGNEMVIDTTTLYPLRQIDYISKASVQFEQGGVKQLIDWYDPKDFTDTFLGANLRLGVGRSFVEEFAAMLDTADLDAGDRMARAAGRFAGNFTQTLIIPYNQVLEIQKGLGIRDPNIKDTSYPLFVGKGNFTAAFNRGFKKYGTPSDYNLLPDQIFVLGDRNTYNKISGAITGIKPIRKGGSSAEYLKYLGFNDFGITEPKNKSPRRLRKEKELLISYLDILVEDAKTEEAYLRNDYASRLDKSISEELYVKKHLRGLINRKLKTFRIQNFAELDDASYDETVYYKEGDVIPEGKRVGDIKKEGGNWYLTFTKFKRSFNRFEREAAIYAVKENRARGRGENDIGNIDLDFNDISTLDDLTYAAEFNKATDGDYLEYKLYKSIRDKIKSETEPPSILDMLN